MHCYQIHCIPQACDSIIITVTHWQGLDLMTCLTSKDLKPSRCLGCSHIRVNMPSSPLIQGSFKPLHYVLVLSCSYYCHGIVGLLCIKFWIHDIDHGPICSWIDCSITFMHAIHLIQRHNIAIPSMLQWSLSNSRLSSKDIHQILSTMSLVVCDLVGFSVASNNCRYNNTNGVWFCQEFLKFEPLIIIIILLIHRHTIHAMVRSCIIPEFHLVRI